MNKIKLLASALAFVAFAVVPNSGLFASSEKIHTPSAVLRIENPKDFSKNIANAARKITNDPQVEMTIAMSLAVVGYPEFNDVDPSAKVVFCYYLDDSSPTGFEIFAVVKAGTNSLLATNLDKFQKYNARDGDLLFIDLMNNPSFPSKLSEYIPSLKKEFLSESSNDSASLEVNVKTFKPLLKELPSDGLPDAAKKNVKIKNKAIFAVAMLLDEMDALNTSFKILEDEIFLEYSLSAKEESALAKSFNLMKTEKIVDEAKFIPQDAPNHEIYALSQESIKLMFELFKNAAAKSEYIKKQVEKFELLASKFEGTAVCYQKIEKGEKFSLPSKTYIARTKASENEIFDGIKNYLETLENYIEMLSFINPFARDLFNKDILSKTKADKLSDIEEFKSFCEENPSFADTKIMHLYNEIQIDDNKDAATCISIKTNFYAFKFGEYAVFSNSAKELVEFLKNTKSPPSKAKKIDGVYSGKCEASFMIALIAQANFESSKKAPDLKIFGDAKSNKIKFMFETPYKFINSIYKAFNSTETLQAQ